MNIMKGKTHDNSVLFNIRFSYFVFRDPLQQDPITNSFAHSVLSVLVVSIMCLCYELVPGTMSMKYLHYDYVCLSLLVNPGIVFPLFNP